MEFFPLFANLKGQPCLLVGGGPVATRKARELAAAGAALTVNAPACTPAMEELLEQTPTASLHRGPFEPRLVAEHVLIVAATDDAAVNRAVAAAAHAARRLCNIVDDGARSTFIMPAVIDRAPVLVAISSGGEAPVLARLLRQQLERWLPARLGRLARWAGSWRKTVHAALRDPASRRAFWERALTGPEAEQVLADDEAAANDSARRLLDSLAASPVSGHAWLVGAGPGDPGLISLRGLHAIEQADVILHDRLVSPELLRAARREAQIVCVGKTGGAPSTSQDEINRLLVRHVRAGRRVCRLKGGDPFIFGRGGEEALALAAADLSFEIVPGITAASGCAAYAGIPLTHRAMSTAVTLVTASTAEGAMEPDWARLAASGHTLAIYMGGRSLAEVAARLVQHGLGGSTPVALISSGTTAAQATLITTLGDMIDGDRVIAPRSPLLLIVGDTVSLAGVLARQNPTGFALPSPLLARAS